MVALEHAEFGGYLYQPRSDPECGAVYPRPGNGQSDVISFAAASSRCLAVVRRYAEDHVTFWNPRAGVFLPSRAVVETGYGGVPGEAAASSLIRRMPPSVRHLVIGHHYSGSHIDARMLPPGLVTLRSMPGKAVFGGATRWQVLSLPRSLLELHLDRRFSLSLCAFPPGIVSLTVHACDPSRVRGWKHALPRGLRELTLVTKEHVGECYFGFDGYPCSLEKLTVLGMAHFDRRLPEGLLEFRWDCDRGGGARWAGGGDVSGFTARGCLFSSFDRLPRTLRALHLPLAVFSEQDARGGFPPPAVRIRLDCVSGPIPRLPAGLRALHLGAGDYELVPDLPAALEHLYAGGGRVSAFPQGLASFSCGTGYAQPIPPLPGSLVLLDLGNGFCAGLAPIEGERLLPESLAELRAGDAFNSPLGPLPHGLRVLVLGNAFAVPLPPLPPGLSLLSLGDSFNRHLALPRDLATLSLGSSFNRPLRDLPPRLSSLKLGDAFNRPLGTLPPTLLCLEIGDSFDQPLGPLPTGLTQLVLGNAFNRRLGPLPLSTRTLRIGNAFTARILSLPRGISQLHLGRSFDCKLPPLPEGLEALHLGDSFTHELPPLPRSLRVLALPKKYERMIPLQGWENLHTFYA